MYIFTPSNKNKTNQMNTTIPNFPFYTRKTFSDGQEWSVSAHLAINRCITVSAVQNHIKEEIYPNSGASTSELDAYIKGEATLIHRVEYDQSFEKTLKQIVNLVEP
jgi:hypothetical protein